MKCVYEKAFVMKVVDGDTVDVNIDLGFGTHKHERLRLARINAWEVRGTERPAGLLARDWLKGQILGKTVQLETFDDKQGKYGRYIAEIVINGASINDALVANGHAKYQNY